MRRHTAECWLLAGAVLASAPSAVCAYSDPGQFAAPALEGGAEGRFYTGSPADAYGCETCHAGGATPSAQLSGVPARYVPGATYELRVSWSRSLKHVSALLELTDEQGKGAGSLVLPGREQYVDAELCEPAADGVLAAQLFDAEHARTVAATPDCGATALRVQWTAPASSAGPVWLAGGVVAANHDGDFSGDGVTNFAQPIPAFGEAPPDAVAVGACSIVDVGARSRSARSVAILVVLLATLGFMRSTRRTRITRALALSAGLLTGCTVDEPGRERHALSDVVHGKAVVPWDGSTPAELRDGAIVASGDAGAARDAGTYSSELAFRVTTLPQGGRYQPKNIGAIWIEDASGNWVKTLALWANVRLRHLGKYLAANKNRDVTDAITSATLRVHETHDVGWDLTDASGRRVADGTYVVRVEATDRDGPGQSISIEFTKSIAPMLIMPDDTKFFVGVELRYE